MKAFNTKSDVVLHLTRLAEQGLLRRHSQGWSQPGTYHLRHGEYAKPDYRPSRYRDGWGVAKVNYYYAGTLNAPPERHRVDLCTLEDVDGFTRLTDGDQM